MKLLVCAGGTGGGVYPALAVLERLANNQPADILWVGSEGGMEADLVLRAGINFTTIPAAGVHGVGLKALPGNIARLMRGYTAARKVLREFQPDALFFTELRGMRVGQALGGNAVRAPSERLDKNHERTKATKAVAL